MCNKIRNSTTLKRSDLLSQLENVTINDVLPLKAARRDPIANLNVLGPRTPET